MSEEKGHHCCCYCRREFTILSGINTHSRPCNILDISDIDEILTTPIDFNKNFIESVPEIKTDDLSKNIKVGWVLNYPNRKEVLHIKWTF